MGERPGTRWRVLAAALAASLLLGGGCGDGGDGPAVSDRGQIEAVLTALWQAQESGDAELACRDIYVVQDPERPGTEGAAAAEAEGEGEETTRECEAAFERADARRREEVRDLTTKVTAVELDGDSATAVVHTTLVREDGSKLDQDVPYDLVRTEDGWRVRIGEEG